MQSSISLIRPDDWHVHLRDGAYLQTSVAHTAVQFARAIVMPNLKPPVVTTKQAIAYRQRIVQAIPHEATFAPLMTLYLTDNTDANEVHLAHEAGIVAFKLYPAGATTNSDAGVTDLRRCRSAFEAMQRHGMPLLIHGEVTNPDVDVFDREAIFIERVLQPLRQEMPELKIVLEHITTREAVQYVAEAGPHTAATVTPQHLLYNRNTLFVGGLRPHYYCLPVLKREEHRQALVAAVTSGKSCYFLGTDSAPHAMHLKENACGCAGCYSAPAALELYAEVFSVANALEKLEAFASHFGPEFYGLPRNTERVTLQRQSWTLPAFYAWGDTCVKPLCGGESLSWKLASG